MKYRTTCPRCASVFRVGTDQLDAAQGWAQCGVCGSAFDARLSLLLEDGSPLPEPEAIEAVPLPETAAPVEDESHDVGFISGGETPEPVPSGEEVLVADTPHGIAQREDSLDLPSIILIDPNFPVSDDPGPLPQIYPAPSSYPREPAASAYSSAPAASAPVARPAARVEYAATARNTKRTPSRPRRISPWLGAMVSVLLLGLLLAQTTYYLRDTLVSRLPQTRPALEQACMVLGCTLSLPKNLAQLQIVGSDLQTEASGRLTLTLTLGNRASHVQAWPVLLLTLTDQHNHPLARRSFAPSEYLGDAERIAAGIPPRSEQPLSLPLKVHNLTPMGFDLQLAY
ncbi:MAG: zinc-ribbon and DUF3426 domain-containing protein [Hyphomicrobiaceae bacterium]